MDRRLTLRDPGEDLRLIPRFKSKDELLEFAKFVADFKREAEAIPAIKTFFKATSPATRCAVIDTKDFTVLATHPMFLPVTSGGAGEVPRAGPGIRQDVSLNQFAT